MRLTKSLVLGLALAAGPASMALPSVRAAGDDPYDGMPVDPDYHYATPPADLCARAGMKYIINTTKHKPKERILERQGEVWLLRGWKSLKFGANSPRV